MKKISLIAVLCLLSLVSFGQDSYHLELLEELDTEYGLSNGNWVFYNSEQLNNNAIFNYGCSKNVLTASDQSFSQMVELEVSQAGDNSWNNAAGLNNVNPIQFGDRILLIVWVRGIEATFSNTGLNAVPPFPYLM